MELTVSEDRKYFAVSIKHSSGWRYGQALTLWGYQRTNDTDKRCFAGYSSCPVRAERYALGEFEADGYTNGGIMKLDEPVHIAKGMVRQLKFDTVLVDAEEYIQYCKENGIRTTPPSFYERLSFEPAGKLAQMLIDNIKVDPAEYGYAENEPSEPCWKNYCERCSRRCKA